MRKYVVLWAASFLAACSTGCQDNVVSRIPAPDGAYDAIYSIHDCGATTREAVWIRVVAGGASPESAEPVATFEGELTSIPEWKGRTLQVHYGHAKPFRMDGSFERVRIEYTPD